MELFAPVKTCRKLGYQAMLSDDGIQRALIMEREQGDAYSALFAGPESIALITIPDRREPTVAIYRRYFKEICENEKTI